MRYSCTMFFIAFALFVSPRVFAQSTLDQKLDQLYTEVSQKFSSDPEMKNPALFLSRKRAPEFQMPTADVFKTMMKAYCNAMALEGGILTEKDRYAFVDFTQNATLRRFYIYDLKKHQIVENTWGSHGDHSVWSVDLQFSDLGIDAQGTLLTYGDENVASFFSNVNGSEESSVGMTQVFTEPYYSELMQRRALRISGLDGELNDGVEERGIVLHRWKITTRRVARSGELGASEGCVRFPNRLQDKMFSLLEGIPLLLYHARMDPVENVKEHNDQVATADDLEHRARLHLEMFKFQSGRSDAQYAEDLEKLHAWFNEHVYSKIEDTFHYFDQESRFVYQPVADESSCISALQL